jgi:hypothetical protein
MSQAENSLLKLQQIVDTANAAKATLEADNLALYSKIRFLQSYDSSNKASIKSPKAMRINNSKNMNIEEGRSNEFDDVTFQSGGNTSLTGDVEKRYHSIYEQRMNPFAEVLLTLLVMFNFY